MLAAAVPRRDLLLSVAEKSEQAQFEGMGCSCSKGQGKIINGNGVEDKLPHRPSTQVEKILMPIAWLV